MLEQLFNLVKEQASEPVINNPVIPNEHNDAVVADATDTVFSGIQNAAAGGGLQNILQLFKGGGQGNSGGIAGLLSNPIVGSLISQFAGKLTGKYNVNSGQASGIAQQLIPSVLSNLVQRTNDPGNSSFDLNGILGSLAGGGGTNGGGLDIGSLVSKVTSMGGDVDGDGDSDLQDMIARFTQGAQQQQQTQSSGGGIMDLIKGFMR
ncbi:MAG: hypothetical protein K2X48_13900 [Chitinophagaceae bacterium]|nr:hypothetical protein [Chitinophagaceae bacterium]